jgi:hypothetical protein
MKTACSRMVEKARRGIPLGTTIKHIVDDLKHEAA